MTAEQVKQLRKQLDYTQAELATVLGVHKLTVSAWEMGRRNVSQPTEIALKSLRKNGKRNESGAADAVISWRGRQSGTSRSNNFFGVCRHRGSNSRLHLFLRSQLRKLTTILEARLSKKDPLQMTEAFLNAGRRLRIQGSIRLIHRLGSLRLRN